jgi:site-specific DNA-methyltransferase (adenine-specific)
MTTTLPTTTLYIGDCLDILKDHRRRYHAIITDPPYEIGLHGKEWDTTGVSFSPELWRLLYDALKPGGFIAAFSTARHYHRLAQAAEAANFIIYPFLGWTFANGLPKPINVSELCDRELPERPIIGWRQGSGFTRANVDQGVQRRTHTTFAVKARHVSSEAKQWEGWYYGVNCLRPIQEPILLAQKPIRSLATGRQALLDNLRKHCTGALNLGALRARYGGGWPSTQLDHAKARRTDHGSTHPSVKPIGLLEDLCLLLCPPAGHILDPFGGTGTTALAARLHGFTCTLIEINRDMEVVIRRRLGEDPRSDHVRMATTG